MTKKSLLIKKIFLLQLLLSSSYIHSCSKVLSYDDFDSKNERLNINTIAFASEISSYSTKSIIIKKVNLGSRKFENSIISKLVVLKKLKNRFIAAEPEIDVLGNSISISDGSTTTSTNNSTDFGSTEINNSISITYAIKNDGNTPLNIGAINFTGTNASNFTLAATPNPTVKSGESITLTVNFTPNATGIRTATISIINNDNNENPYNFLIQGTGLAPLANGPGGVTSDLQLWLRSDLLNGTTSISDNTNVTTWSTQASGNSATKPANVGAPVYKNNATDNINFNAVVDFTNNYNTAQQVYTDFDPTRQYLKGSSGFYSQDVFIVMVPDVTVTSTLPSMDVFCGDNDSTKLETDATGIGYGAYTSRMDNEVLTYAIGTSSGSGLGYGVADTGTTKSYSRAGIINARNNTAISGTELYFNANNILNFTTDSGLFKNVLNTQYWIGRSEGWDGSLDGRVAEIITYSSRKNDGLERNKIQSYLAIKYGITLGINGTSINYTNSTGTSIWDVSANNNYNYDIAGIGRDDLSKLNQKQSKSINTSNEITIGLNSIEATNTANTNTFDTDKKFLVWGNNHGTLAAQPEVTKNISSGITTPTTLTSNVSFIPIGRTWKIVETGGNVPTVKISIPTTMLSATLTPPGDYLMFISNTPNFDPTAEYRAMSENGSNLETLYDFDGTKYITFGFAPEKTFERCVKFNGSTDYIDAGQVLNLNTSFTVSAWVNRNSASKTILSKRDSGFTTGYDLSINAAGKAEMSWMVGATKYTITSNAAIPVGIWHHIGVVYNGTTAKIYVDGITKNSATMPNVPTNTQSFIIAAADGVNTTSYFNGSIDEVRVWNVALTENQFRYVINQEVQSNSTLANGTVIPNTITLNDISSIAWTSLNAYYPMSTYTYTNAKDKSSYNLTAALINLKTVDRQTAPLPYESQANGLWQTPGVWLNNAVQDLPNSTSIEDPTKTVDWNIVKVTNTITSQGNKTLLGLYVGVETGSTLTATTAGGQQTDGTKIEVSHYLKLDGKIDLVGRSQLVQKLGSDLDVTSSGSIERDQQGQANEYNYNYWASPVGTINGAANNTPFTVGSVLNDGTNPNSPIPINWIGGYDSAPTAPISLARYWVYKFDNLSNNYSNWTQIYETGVLRAGKGFTLKGSGAATATQNLTFVGKPNNGTINNSVGINQLLLTGNPYPSAIDADAFITDNINSIQGPDNNTIDGTLYFWEHYASNNTHNLAGYQGGYAARNLTGGLAPSSSGVDFISKEGSPSRGIPNKFIPVGQGFFVIGSSTGGNVIFKNSQRGFEKETDANSNVLYKIATNKPSHWLDNTSDVIQKDDYKRIRLGFNSQNDFHRQVLIGFMNEKATSEMDYGYDGLSFDAFSNDMYLLNGESQLIIQGEGRFNEEASYPIGVRTDAQGKISFVLDGLENFDDDQTIFIYDKLDDTYHNIKEGLYEVELTKGTFNDRFFLRFTAADKTLGTDTFEIAHSVIVIVNEKVTVKSSKEQIKSIDVFDLSGRKIGSYKKLNTAKFTLNHLNKNTMGLILKITLENDAMLSRKIIY
jgi:hypothetical protein